MVNLNTEPVHVRSASAAVGGIARGSAPERSTNVALTFDARSVGDSIEQFIVLVRFTCMRTSSASPTCPPLGSIRAVPGAAGSGCCTAALPMSARRVITSPLPRAFEYVRPAVGKPPSDVPPRTTFTRPIETPTFGVTVRTMRSRRCEVAVPSVPAADARAENVYKPAVLSSGLVSMRTANSTWNTCPELLYRGAADGLAPTRKTTVLPSVGEPTASSSEPAVWSGKVPYHW